MNAFTANASLVLYPAEPNWVPENLEALIKFLQETGLAGDALHQDENSFSVGENFLEHISFMGCSPSINFSNENKDGKFTFIRLTLTPTITALTGSHSFAPHCPHCKKAEKNWREHLKNHRLQCGHCQETADAWQYNWRKSAGFGRCFIEITDIYPKEAMPQPSLLLALENHFQVAWKYFFYYP